MFKARLASAAVLPWLINTPASLNLLVICSDVNYFSTGLPVSFRHSNHEMMMTSSRSKFGYSRG